MTPIAVTAMMRGPVTSPPMLDGILAFVVAQRMGLVAGFGPMQPIQIPIAKEPGARFYLCSSPVASWDQHERRFVNRRFPVPEAQIMASPKLRRVNVSAGSCRSYRIPGDVAWADGDAIRWYLLGDAEPIRELLSEVTHLGKRRAVGRGAIARWDVDDAEPWGDDFPVVRAGRAMRPLPIDWPGLDEDAPRAYHTLAAPYYDHTAEVLCAVPG